MHSGPAGYWQFGEEGVRGGDLELYDAIGGGVRRAYNGRTLSKRCISDNYHERGVRNTEGTIFRFFYNSGRLATGDFISTSHSIHYT